MAKKKSTKKSTKAPKGLSFSSLVKAQGGAATNRQTGAKTYASGYEPKKSSGGGGNYAVIDSNTSKLIQDVDPSKATFSGGVPNYSETPTAIPAAPIAPPVVPPVAPIAPYVPPTTDTPELPIKPPDQSIEDYTNSLQTSTGDYEFSSEQDFFTRTGLKDFSSVQTIKRGQTPTSSYYKYDDSPAVFQKSTPAPGAQISPLVATSAVERAKQRAAELERIKGELSGGIEAPAPFKSLDEYDRLRQEQGIVVDEEELGAIRDEALSAQQELRVFRSTAGQGVSEGGRIGAVSEAERNLSFRLEGLAIREQAVLSRINNKNSYIDTAMKLGYQDYQTAYNSYSDQYNRNLQAIQMYNQEEDERKQDAMTGFTTMVNLLSESGISSLTPELSMQLDTLALQSGLPSGAFQTALQGIAKKERIDNLKIVGNDIYMWTSTPDGTPQLKLVQSLPGGGEQTSDITEYEYAKSQGYTGTFQQWVDRTSRFKATGEGTTTATLGADINADVGGLLAKWNSGYLQGNGKISSSDYRAAKSQWIQNYAGDVANPGQQFDGLFSYLADQSGYKWEADYGINK